MTPNFTVGVFSQRDFRGHGSGPLDDCWVCSDQMALHACAPWEAIHGIKPYRSAAGVPDTNTGSEGGSLEAGLKAVKALWPKIGAMTELYRSSWTGFVSKAKASQRPVSGSVWSKALGYNTEFRHRVAFYWNGSTWRMLDPLKVSFSEAQDVSEAFVRAAFAQHPDAAEVNCLIFPTVEQAFTTHPLYSGSGATEQQLAAARALGFNDGKTKATKAVQSITL